jgi:cbb3-type cytochrome oxidase cytochrome c subunit
MKGIASLFLGIFGTFAFSWVGLVLIPNYQIGHLDPQVDEDGNDPYPAPKSGMADRGRRIYAANGCVYCHSQQVRADYSASDIDRKWGSRRSAPRDYLFERPVVLGKMRLGPDLANIGKRAPVEEEGASPAATPTPAGPVRPLASPPTPSAAAPPASSPAATATPAPASAPASPTLVNDAPPAYSAEWHHRHLYSPRSLVLDSNMPAYHFLYEKRRISGERAVDAVKLGERDAVAEGWEVVPTYDAKCLVAYLMSLDQSHALKEVKATTAPPTAPAPSPAPAKEAK